MILTYLPGNAHTADLQHQQTPQSPPPPILAIKFSTDDLATVSHFLGLKVIQSSQAHEGSCDLYLYEQLAFLDSLTSVEPPALKKRRMRHQHFWRDADKLAFQERVYVRSADVQLALEVGTPVTTCTHLGQADHTSVWTVCLTGHGAKELLNRKISPIGQPGQAAEAGLCMYHGVISHPRTYISHTP